MRHWTFWEWIAYVALFVAALIVAADTGFRESPDVMARLPEFFHSEWWGFAPAALVVVATIILLLREFVVSNNKFHQKATSNTASATAHDRINPAQKTFANVRINIHDLLPPAWRIIDSKDFIECDIIGPANVLIEGKSSILNSGYATVDFVLIRQDRGIHNVIVFKDCTFQRCKFFNITIFAPPPYKQKYEKGLNTPILWLNDTLPS